MAVPESAFLPHAVQLQSLFSNLLKIEFIDAQFRIYSVTLHHTEELFRNILYLNLVSRLRKPSYITAVGEGLLLS